MPANPETVAALVALLSPLKGTGEPYWIDLDYPEESDKCGPDDPIRDAIREALEILDLQGPNFCRLCMS